MEKTAIASAAPSSILHPPSSSFLPRLRTFAADIKIAHTIFAMPWAILATFLAAGGTPRLGQILLIVGCMVTARTVAMSANRLIDARLDALNPRTARRAIPSGQLPRAFVITITVACILAFFLFAFTFYLAYSNPWPIILAAPVLAFISLYPYMKRFTRFCHYYLGAALALAPVCAYLAIAGHLTLEPILMAAAVLLWTAGFDIIYACQDYASDVASGVFSVPAGIGIARALWVARLTHAACVALLVTLGLISPALRALYFIGVGIAVALLVIEHAIVKPNDLSKVGLAFFTVNGIIALVLGTLGVIDVYL